jgi:hypothetical protein
VGALRSCGHDAPPRRLCDLCDAAVAAGLPARGPFLACSLACLDAHQAAEHAAEAGPARARAERYQASVNANGASDWARFAPHRAQLARLIEAEATGSTLGVLGAGNGSDLDLSDLARSFRAIHLVDLDERALIGCRDRLPGPVRDQVVLHGGVDLTGCLDRIDAWGEAFPPEAELGRLAVPAIQQVLREIGTRFDTAISTCVLSQLAVPFHRSWVLPGTSWAQLHAALTAVHLSTLAGAVVRGGACILVFDVLSSRTAPALRDLRGDDPGALEAFLADYVAGGGAPPNPAPDALLGRLRAPGMDRFAEAPRLVRPWLWNIGAETQLVYALVFRRPAARTA